jgi:hypothetical protein
MTFKTPFVACAFIAAPACAQDPTLIIPGKDSDKKVPARDSKSLASTNVPPSLQALGLLRNDLAAYFAMDSKESGGLTWSRRPLALRATSGVQEKTEGPRRYLDFSANGSIVTFESPYPTGGKFTFCAWVLLPPPHQQGIIWGAEKGELLMFSKDTITTWDHRGSKSKLWAKSTVEFSGWHHVAVAYDGKQTQAFLDAKPLAIIEGLPAVNVVAVGNHKEQQHRHWNMPAAIDEQFFFTRALTPAEITTVMRFSRAGDEKK